MPMAAVRELAKVVVFLDCPGQDRMAYTESAVDRLHEPVDMVPRLLVIHHERFFWGQCHLCISYRHRPGAVASVL
jgi:hypothetical protein